MTGSLAPLRSCLALLAALGLLTPTACSSVRSSHPLIDALRTGDATGVDAQLADGADPKMTLRDGSTTLTAACQSGELALVQKMVDLGAEIAVKDSGGKSALHYCDYHVGFPGVRYLVEKGADPAELITAEKAVAVFRGCMTHTFNREEVEFYASRGLKVPATLDADSGLTPLHCTAGRDLMEYSAWLLDHGADPKAADAKGVTPLMALLRVETTPTTTAHVALLLDKGASVNAVDGEGRGLVSRLAASTEPAIVADLFKRGLKVHEADRLGAFYKTAIAPLCDGQPDEDACAKALFTEGASD